MRAAAALLGALVALPSFGAQVSGLLAREQKYPRPQREPRAPAKAVAIPGGAAGVGFVDLSYAPELHRLLVPAGGLGRLVLIDPETLRAEVIAGLQPSGHRATGEGATTADASGKLIVAADRGSSTLFLIDGARKQVATTVSLQGRPGVLRVVASIHEVWVTEPKAHQIEIFQLQEETLTLLRVGAVRLPDGPVSLAIDETRERAYTSGWTDAVFAIDLRGRATVARWSDGCKRSRALALAEKSHLLFAGCEEGKVVSLDLAKNGERVGAVRTGPGVSALAYDPLRARLAAPGADDGSLTWIAVSSDGGLSALGRAKGARGARCVVVSPAGQAFVCEPLRGRLLIVDGPDAGDAN